MDALPTSAFCFGENEVCIFFGAKGGTTLVVPSLSTTVSRCSPLLQGLHAALEGGKSLHGRRHRD